MKRTLSLLLAVLMTLTAFGATAVFGGVFGAGAEFLDYFNYVQIPGFTAYTEAGLKAAYQPHYTFLGFDSEFKPEGVDKVAKFQMNRLDKWNGGNIHTFNQVTFDDSDSANWQANAKIEDTDIFGDTGYTFADATGFTFWVGLNGAPYQGSVKIILHQVTTKGPFYGGGDLTDFPVGFLYECQSKQVDADGYIYFDFKTDFTQADWWSTDDEGIKRYEQGQTPFPEKFKPLLNAFQIRINGAQQVGDVVSIGDFRICYDTRIHTDELDEQLAVFDSLDPEAYTEESYAAAQEVYLEAFEVYLDPPDQKVVNAAVADLKAAIKALKPLFHASNKDIQLEGFEVWTEEDLDEMSAAGLDTSVIDVDNVPVNRDQSVMIMANAMQGPPTYGWSWFTNGADEGATAIGNPFALKEGSAPLSEANGIRFWVKWDESLDPIPVAMRVGVGSSESGVYFECDDYSLTLPASEGYVGIPWTTLYDLEGEADIYDYIDELDYISIFIEGAVGIYYIADFHAFNWNVSSADFTELSKTIVDTDAYLNTLNKADWYYRSWNRVEAAIAAGEAMLGAYAVTQEEVDAAREAIISSVNKLILNEDLATEETMDKLEALYAAAKNCWRGNVTPASYRTLMEPLETAATLIEEGPKEEVAQECIVALEAAINGLVPIKAGEKVTSIVSFESWNNRMLNKANGDRTEGVIYSLAEAADVPGIPEGYAKALKMVATEDMSAANSDEHGVMQFKAMSRDTGGVVPVLLGPNNENTLIGDLTGTDGICLWIGVNDVNLVQDCSFRFAVSNCTVGPLFERAAHDIPLPSTGSGWLYIPWEYFEFYDDWTHGEPINLAKIYFYILRFNGIVKSGLEAYVTGIHAYKNTTEGEWEVPVVTNIEEGATIDISTNPLVPKWSVGTATLDGKNFIFGSPVVTNGAHVLEVRNGSKVTTVNFTTTGAAKFDTPVITGVENGGKYPSATISWDIGTATLNGEPVESGIEVTEVGRYTLIVTNGTEVVTIDFAIVDEPAGKKGDFDGDGKITVSDALAALRIAAKMVEETADDIAIGDIDKDNKITVSDSLAILRVAAKMAGEDTL